MAPQTFDCPNCGAPLDYTGSDPIIRCPYCNSSVIVPENLRAQPSFSAQPDNFTLSGIGDLRGLIQQAQRFKEVKDLAQSGRMEDAVSLYRQITGSTPEAARASVEALALGHPITLTSFTAADVASAVRTATTPSIKIKPVDDKTSKNIARNIGCGIGCFVVGLVLFILATTLIPVLGGLAGVAVSANPEIVLTALPAVENVTNPGIATQEMSFGGEGTGPGLFKDVRAIAIDPGTGNIYAADYDGGRIQAFDPTGKFITQWIPEGKTIYVSDIAIDRSGNVFVLQTGKLYRYDLTGKLIGQVETDAFSTLDSLIVAADGSLWATDSDTIIHMDVDGQVLDQYPGVITAITDDPELDAKIAIDGEGYIYLLGTFSNAIFKFSPDGKFINQFGSDGDEPGQFRAPYAIAVDGKGHIFVSDVKGVQVFSNDGRYLNVFKVSYFAYGIAIDDQGKLYITTNQKKVEKYSIQLDQ